MEMRHLRYFLAVAAELHFTRAAERLNISVPTLSNQIKALESFLGVALFVRNTKKKVSMTFAGEQLQKRALTLYESFEQTQQFARQAARGEVGEIRLGYVLSAATAGYVNKAIALSRQASPNISVTIRHTETITQLKEVITGNLDVGFMRRMRFYPPEIAAFNIGRQRLCVAIHRDHPLAKLNRITPALLAKQALLAYTVEAELRFSHSISAVLPPSAIPQIVQRTGDALSLLTMVGSNLGLAIVPESFGRIVSAPIAIRNISGPQRYAEQVAVFRASEASPVIGGFLKTIRSAFSPSRAET
jgi:DNA-binding transcriptional LysR family regulator